MNDRATILARETAACIADEFIGAVIVLGDGVTRVPVAIRPDPMAQAFNLGGFDEARRVVCTAVRADFGPGGALAHKQEIVMLERTDGPPPVQYTIKAVEPMADGVSDQLTLESSKK